MWQMWNGAVMLKTVKLLQESQINLSRHNSRLKTELDQLTGQLAQCGGAERISALRAKITGRLVTS